VDSLHFAGEATSDDYIGYLHGGYYSGIRAAREILAGSNGNREKNRETLLIPA
jgi:monoamine oxidase